MRSGRACRGCRTPPNAELALFGGAAFERVMTEFQSAVSALGFPGGIVPVKPP